MEKILINKPILQEIKNRACSKDLERSALGYIYKNDLEYTIKQIKELLGTISIDTWDANIGQYDNKIDIYSKELRQELDILPEDNSFRVGIFLEPIYISTREKDDNRYMIWIYFTLKGKRLTKFKKFLMTNVFKY